MVIFIALTFGFVLDDKLFALFPQDIGCSACIFPWAQRCSSQNRLIISILLKVWGTPDIHRRWVTLCSTIQYYFTILTNIQYLFLWTAEVRRVWLKKKKFNKHLTLIAIKCSLYSPTLNSNVENFRLNCWRRLRSFCSQLQLCFTPVLSSIISSVWDNQQGGRHLDRRRRG